MPEILNYLQNDPNYTNIDSLYTYIMPQGEKHITHIYAQKGLWSFEITAPHSGIGGRFLLRANPTATLDRWSTAAYDTLLDSWQNVVQDLSYENYQYEIGEMAENW